MAMLAAMRHLIAVAILASAASPVAAQILAPQVEDLRMQQEAAQRRAIDQSNQLNALENRLRAEQAAADLQRPPPRLPEIRYKAATGVGFTPAMPPNYPAVPDATLADSNKRVQDAARKRR
jgi:hypothetical protein